MSSAGFSDSLELRPGRSARLHRSVFALHALALGVLPWSMAPGLPMVAIAAGLAVSWWVGTRHAAFGAGPRALQRLIWHPDDHWTIFTAAGRRSDARLRPDSIVRGPLLILRFDVEGSRTPALTRLLCGDELDAEAWRRLRARLSVPPLS